MAGFLTGLGQAISGGLKGWERASQWEREEAAARYAEEARNQNRETWAREARVRERNKEFKLGDPVLDDPDGEGGDVPAAPEPAQQVAADTPSTEARGPAPVAAPVPIQAALPLTDTQKAAASVAPAATGLPATPAAAAPAATPAPVDPLDEPVTVPDRLLGTPTNTTKRRTRPANDFDVAMRRYDNFMEEGMTTEATAVMQAYATKDKAKLEEADRQYESGMNMFIASGGQDRTGLDRANRLNPIGVDLDMRMDPSGSGRIAVGMNMRGTKGPGMFRGPDGEMAKDPIYMDPREAMVLAKGIGNGGTLAALNMIVELRSKVQGIQAQKQGMQVQLTQVAQNAYQLYLNAKKEATDSGGVAPNINDFMAGLTVPDQQALRAKVAGEAPTQGLPGGTGGTGGRGGGGFLDTLAQVESGDRNIPSGVDSDVAGPGTKSQGHFQINTPTWRDFAGKAGVDIKQYPNAMSAPREVQAQVASVIPFKRFGPRTQRMMTEKYGPLDRNATVGTLAARYGGGGGGGGTSGTGTGLPTTSTATTPTPTPTPYSNLDIKPDPKFADATQYNTKPKMDEGVKTLQAQAASTGANARQAVFAKATTEGRAVDDTVQAEANAAYKNGYTNHIANALNMMSEGDRRLMTPMLLPNAAASKDTGAFGGPSKESKAAGNRFAVQPFPDAVRMLRELTAIQGKDIGYVGPEQRKRLDAWNWLREHDPNYANRLAREAKKLGPVKGEEGANPAARKANNVFAAGDYADAQAKMQLITPFLYSGAAAPKRVKTLLAQFDELRKLDPDYAFRLETTARKALGPTASNPMALGLPM